MKQYNIEGHLVFVQYANQSGWEWVAWTDSGEPQYVNGTTEHQAVEAMRRKLCTDDSSIDPSQQSAQTEPIRQPARKHTRGARVRGSGSEAFGRPLPTEEPERLSDPDDRGDYS